MSGFKLSRKHLIWFILAIIAYYLTMAYMMDKYNPLTWRTNVQVTFAGCAAYLYLLFTSFDKFD